MSIDEESRDRVRLCHMRDEIAEIEKILSQKDRGSLMEAALERKYIVIGEACRALSDGLKTRYADVPWNSVIAMRNILVHEYYKVDKDTLWSVAEHKIPALKDWIIGIIENSKD